jgi:hypothetical protein
MPYCPVCKHEFEADVTECPTDKTPLVDELPFQTVEGSETVWVEIASAVTEDQARLLQGFLEASGIPTQIESLKFTMEPVNLGALAEIRVFVESTRGDEALRLLEERDDDFESMRSDESVMTDDGPATIVDDAETASDDDDGAR